MNFVEFQTRFNQIEVEATKQKERLVKEYVDLHNPYKVGDIFTDHIGSIRIERIIYSYSPDSRYPTPYFVYEGTELKKDGTPKKITRTRKAWLVNEQK